MSAQRVLQFPRAADARNRCLLCGGTGWRPTMADAHGNRRVARCECVLRRMQEARQLRVEAVEQRDYKAAAAGER